MKFRDAVVRSVRHVISLLASEGLRYPGVIITGGAAILLEEPRLEEVYHTGDVDISSDFITDINEIFLTLMELERKHPDKVFVIGTGGIVRFAPLEEGILPVDFIHPVEAKLRDVFQYAHQNAKVTLTTLRVRRGTTIVHVARLEDAILCKLAVHRRKDIETLRRIVPKLDALDRLDWEYLGELGRRFGLEKEVTALKKCSA